MPSWVAPATKVPATRLLFALPGALPSGRLNNGMPLFRRPVRSGGFAGLSGCSSRPARFGGAGWKLAPQPILMRLSPLTNKHREADPPADSGGDAPQEGTSHTAKKVGQRPLLEQAHEYLDLCQGSFTQAQAGAEQASVAGSSLILRAGSFKSAVDAVGQARLEKKGRDLLKAVTEGRVNGLSELHAAHLLEMSEEGIPSRRSDLQASSSKKAWKDAAYGPVMEGIPQLLEEAGVAESPLKRVPE